MGMRELVFAAAAVLLMFWAAKIVARTAQRRAAKLEWLLLGGLVLVAGYTLVDGIRRNERASEWFRTRACRSNLKQIWAAMALYAGDSDGWFPVGPEGTDAFHALGMIAYQESGYLCDHGAFVCPSSEEAVGRPVEARTPIAADAAGLQPSSTSYVYLPGLRIDDPPNLFLIAEKRPDQHGKARHVLTIDGRVELLEEAEFQPRIFGQMGWKR